MRSFFNVEWSIISYLLTHTAEVQNLTVSDLSKETFASADSIVRLSKKLGYDGFQSCKVALIKDLESKKYINTSVDFSIPFDLNSSAQNIINSMFSLYKQVIDIAHASLDAKQLERITDYILNCKRLILFGFILISPVIPLPTNSLK